MQRKAILILENEKIFRGYALSSIGHTIKEVCFNTGMTGYQKKFNRPFLFWTNYYNDLPSNW